MTDEKENAHGTAGRTSAVSDDPAEKALKAWLTILGIDFPRTHDLSLLIHKLDEGGAEILDDEPLDHEATLAQVTALLNHVESLRTPERDPEK